jgi:hypothetical protein
MPLGRVVPAVEPEPPDVAEPEVAPGVAAEPVVLLPLEAVPDADEPGACCLTVFVETSQHWLDMEELPLLLPVP